MVQLLVRIHAGKGQVDRVVEALHRVIRTLRVEGACVDTYAATDVEDGDVVWFCEEWPDRAAFEAHVRSDRFGQLLALIETAVEPPLLECRNVSEPRGLDYIATVRGALSPNH